MKSSPDFFDMFKKNIYAGLIQKEKDITNHISQNFTNLLFFQSFNNNFFYLYNYSIVVI